MENEFQIKAIIEKHMNAMVEEIANTDNPPGWFGEQAPQRLTDVVYGTLAYSADVERYLEKEGRLKP